MSEIFHGEIPKHESESKVRQQDIDVIYLSLMKNDFAKKEEREAREKEVRAAEMRLMLDYARKEGFESQNPRFEWDYIILDRPPMSETIRNARVVLEYGADAKDRIREMYEGREQPLNGEVMVHYTIKKTYSKPPEKVREPSWHVDNNYVEVVETLVPDKEIILQASPQALEKLEAEREHEIQLAREQDRRYQGFLKQLQQYRKKMPLKLTLEDIRTNPYLPLHQGLKEFVPQSFFEKNSGSHYGFRIRPEGDGFVLESFFKQSGLVNESFYL